MGWRRGGSSIAGLLRHLRDQARRKLMVVKGNNLHRQFSFNDEDALDSLDLHRNNLHANQLNPAASVSFNSAAFASSSGSAGGATDPLAPSIGSQPHSVPVGTVFGGSVPHS